MYTLWPNNSTPRFKTNRNTCTWALRDKDENLRDALFVMAPNWKEPKCLSKVGWTQEWSTHALSCIHHIMHERNVTLYTDKNGWPQLNSTYVMLSEGGHTQTIHAISLHTKFKNRQYWTEELEVRMLVPSEEQGGARRLGGCRRRASGVLAMLFFFFYQEGGGDNWAGYLFFGHVSACFLTPVKNFKSNTCL